MFERFTEKARRVVFFARYEASQYGSAAIGPEHLLLGLLREDRLLLKKLSSHPGGVAAIREQIERGIERRERIPTSVEIPLSPECRKVLDDARAEAERMRHRWIGTEHLLLGLLQVDQESIKAIMEARKVTRAGILRFMVAPWPQRAEEAKLYDPRLREDGPTGALNNFMGALRAGLKDTGDLYFSPVVKFIDATGKSWSGQEAIQENLAEIFGPYAAKKARYQVEDALEVHPGTWIISLLWEDVPLAQKTPKGLCRMVIALGKEDSPETPWTIYTVQVTPITWL